MTKRRPSGKSSKDRLREFHEAWDNPKPITAEEWAQARKEQEEEEERNSSPTPILWPADDA
jgi:hypothetical protein